MTSIPSLPEPAAAPRRRGVGAGSWRGALVTVVAVAALLWLVELVNLASGNRLDGAGIRPRSLVGLWGIIFTPFLHVSIAHLVSNTVPLVVLGWIGLVGNTRRFLLATAIAWVTSGLGIWLIGGAGTVVVGASGVIYGWMGYLIARGWVAHKLGQALVGVVVLVVYGVGAIWAALPFVSGPISWEGHLCGALGGILAAVLLDGRRPERPAPPALPTMPTAPPL